MLRNLVLALLAVNLLYLAWARWIGGGNRSDTAYAMQLNTAAPTSASACAALGPFSEPMLAVQAKRKLEHQGLRVASRETSEAIHDGWWVHVDNADQAQQSRTVESLRRAGMTDALAIPDDPRHRVSVGEFPHEDQARDLAAQVQRLRLDAVVSERLREQTSTWLDVMGITRETLSDGRLAGWDIALDRLRVDACPAVQATPPRAAGADIIPAP